MKLPQSTRAGFTLLEMTIVLLVSAMVFLLAGALQSSYGKRSADLLHRAEVVRELQLAIDTLRADFGAAVLTTREDASTFRIEREPEAMAAMGTPLQGPDSGVRYELDGEYLVRTDLELGGDYVVAQRIESVEVIRQGVEVRITLTAGLGNEEKQITLRWRP